MKQFLWQSAVSKLKMSDQESADNRATVIVEERSSIKEKSGDLRKDNGKCALRPRPHPQKAPTCKDSILRERRKACTEIIPKEVLALQCIGLGEYFSCGYYPRGLDS